MLIKIAKIANRANRIYNKCTLERNKELVKMCCSIIMNNIVSLDHMKSDKVRDSVRIRV
jgi:hypothetical protein